MADSTKVNANKNVDNAPSTPADDDWLSGASFEEVSEETRPEDIPDTVRKVVEKSFVEGKKLRVTAPSEKAAQKLLRQLRAYADVRKDGEGKAAPLTIRAPQVKDGDGEVQRNVVEFRAKKKEYRPRDNNK